MKLLNQVTRHRFTGTNGTLPLLVILFLLLSSVTAFGQDASRTINRSMTFSDLSDPDNKLRAMNINGSVTIEAYDGCYHV